MPELPDIVVYIEALEKRILGHRLQRIQIASPFLVRTAAPPTSDSEGKQVVELRRLGKRICIGLEGELWLVLHLMIAGRLHWKGEVTRKDELRCIWSKVTRDLARSTQAASKSWRLMSLASSRSSHLKITP